MERLDILAVGTALVDSIIKGFDPKPVSASGYRAASGSLNAGGEAVNEAIAAAKLGMQTGILCSLGVDTAGDMLMDVLHRGGVDTSRVLRDEAHPTPVTTMFVHDDGTRKSITNGAHRYNFRPDHHLDRLTGARAVILGSLFRAPFDDPDVALTVAKTVKAEGALLVADTKLPNFTPLTLDNLRDVLPLIDYITPNEDEAKFYTGQTEPEAMTEVFLEAGVKNVILKLGAKGCYFRNKTEKFALPALPIRAVDATGAGDNFVAGFTAARLWGSNHESAMRFANACGAICTTAVGAGTALQNREQVSALLAKMG
ncbi:MAG: carbohydrate kinase family protein [Clostridia bacterium]|nr:carbohydrate kinase family protein [Clostridia bacterium]